MDIMPTDGVHFEMSPEGTWTRAGERWTYTGPCDMIMEMETTEFGTARCQRYGTRIVSVTFPDGGLAPPSHFEYDPVEESTSPAPPADGPPSSAYRPAAVRDWPEGSRVRERSVAAEQPGEARDVDVPLGVAYVEGEEDPEEPEDEEDEEAVAAEGAEAEAPALMEEAEDGPLLEIEEDSMSEDEAPYPWLQETADPAILFGLPIDWDLDDDGNPLPEYHVGSGTDYSNDDVVIQVSSPESSMESTASSRVW